MGEVYFKVPVTCPICRTASLVPFRAAAVFDALTRSADLRLSVPCHEITWYAISGEREHIREYLTINGGAPFSALPPPKPTLGPRIMSLQGPTRKNCPRVASHRRFVERRSG